MSEISPFYREVFSLLRQNGAEVDSGAPLHEIIHNYHQRLKEEHSFRIELQWMNSFSQKEFQEAGLLAYFPRIYRGLPRFYDREDPSCSRIKKNFSHLPTLKALSVDRALFSLYEGVPLEKKMRVAFLTWVIPDGLGDWIAAKEAAALLQAQFPEIELHWFVLTSRSLPFDASVTTHPIFYEKDPTVAAFSYEKKKLLREMDLILQIPTFFPETNLLLGDLSQMASLRPFPKVEHIGEYGFLESGWFHPKTGNRSMGLHALEKGVLIRSMEKASFASLENKNLLLWLFDTETPSPAQVSAYRRANRFHLAYLATVSGGMIYLHSLLKRWEEELAGIDLCTPTLGWFIRWIEERKSARLPLLEEAYGVREIILCFEEHRYVIPIASKGKLLRLLSPGYLSDSDMRKLMGLSEDWVAVRGDQSFTEAVSAGKPFFYDGRSHLRYFVKDLIALAENRLSGYRPALQIFRMIGQAFAWTPCEEEGEWVDESFFHRQERLSLGSIATEIGSNLKSPEALTGFRFFCRIVRDEHSFNPFLCHLVQRSLFHRLRPQAAEEEHRLLSLYVNGHLSFLTLVKNLRDDMIRWR
ncbi:MAG: hypothetical protein KGJ02_00660 [Verrucomicrobiota bacterium]|nr:hypothetical protein [Verrucomicrobiota bacterium]